MYPTVPLQSFPLSPRVPVTVPRGPALAELLAIPKSMSFAPALVTTTFDGLRSRWTMPCRCAASSACGDLPRALQRLRHRQRPAAQPGRERLALDELHHEEEPSVVLAEIVKGADVRVREPGRGARLVLQRGRRSGARRQKLDRDDAVEQGVARPIDLAHAAGSDRTFDLVASDPRACGENHSGRECTSGPSVALDPVQRKP